MNKRWREIIDYWGENNLLRVDRNDMEKSDISDETRTFLEKVGVVKKSRRLAQGLGLRFDLLQNRPLTRLFDYFSNDDAPEDMRSWIPIGHCFEQLLCLEPDSGRVIIIDGTPAEGFLRWNVNSELPKLMYFATRAMKCFETAAGRNGGVDSIQNLIDDLIVVDPFAFEKTTNWWPTILEEVAQGRL